MTGITLQSQTFKARSIPPRGKEHAARMANKQARELAVLTRGMKTLNTVKGPVAPASAPVGTKFVAKA